MCRNKLEAEVSNTKVQKSLWLSVSAIAFVLLPLSQCFCCRPVLPFFLSVLPSTATMYCSSRVSDMMMIKVNTFYAIQSKAFIHVVLATRRTRRQTSSTHTCTHIYESSTQSCMKQPCNQNDIGIVIASKNKVVE
jgi:hypothetical protein